MDTVQFDQQVSDLAAALGDATRRGIYVTVRESPEPVIVSKIAELFDIHANVARHHLDHLVADGYLRVSRKRPEGRSGPGAGRPAERVRSKSGGRVVPVRIWEPSTPSSTSCRPTTGTT